MTNTATTTAEQQPTTTRCVDNYRTLSVTPAPSGWSAIYRDRDDSYSTEPVVAILTQQYTGTTWYENTDVRTDSADHDYDVRTIFAVVERETGELLAVDSHIGGGYYYTELVALATERELHDEWLEIFTAARQERDRRKIADQAART
jgi:hypothetical protein